jgi:quinol monooxygenase YgiN
MWGTIAKMRLKPDVSADYIIAQMNAFDRKRIGGWVSMSLYRADADSREIWMIGMFDSKESYQANAESSAQHSIFTMLRSWLEEDPVWHDVEHLLSLGEADH